MIIGINALWFNGYFAGVERITSSLLAALAEIDADNTYMVFTNSTVPTLACERHSNFQVVRIPRIPKFRLGIEQLYFPLRSMFKADLDVLHTPAFVSPVLHGRGKTRNILTVCDLVPQLYPETQVLKVNIYARLLMPIALRRSQGLIAISNHTRRDLESLLGVSADHVEVIQPGIGAQFRPIDKQQAAELVCRAYGIAAPYILSVGSLEPRKNLARLIDAYARLRRETGCIAKLVLTGGKGWLNSDLDRLIAESGFGDDIIRTGYLADEDLPYLYAAAEVLVYPSLYEGWGLPIVEAMACGTPVITSNLSSMPEAAGGAALLVDPRDPAALAAAMQEVLRSASRRAELVRAGVARTASLSWNRAAEKTLELYRQVGASS